MIKLIPKKNGKGYVTSYSLNIGCAEAKKSGFLDNENRPKSLIKIIKDGEIIIKPSEKE